MSIETREIIVSGVPVSIVRKAIKNLHLGVYPPSGRVRVAAPLALSDEAVRLAVVGRLGWIKRQRARFESQPRQSAREMVSGETHYFLGRRYRLRVVQHDGPAAVVRRQATIELQLRRGTNAGQRLELLQHWYRTQLKALVPPLMEKWSARLQVRPVEWGVRRMKTRWGSCNTRTSRICLNLELAKLPPQCIEYVLVHELAHLIERRHNEHFRAIMDEHLPQWRTLRRQLNAAPLAHGTWTY